MWPAVDVRAAVGDLKLHFSAIQQEASAVDPVSIASADCPETMGLRPVDSQVAMRQNDIPPHPVTVWHQEFSDRSPDADEAELQPAWSA
jgi:hypothetical protein